MKKYPVPNYRDSYDFYKCAKCGRLITHPESLDNTAKGSVCPCGGLKFSPINIRWFQYFLPRVIWFSLLRWRGWA